MQRIFFILLFILFVTACGDDKEDVPGTTKSAKTPLETDTGTVAEPPVDVSALSEGIINAAKDPAKITGENVEYTNRESDDDNFIEEIDEQPEIFIETMEQEAEDLKENMIEEAKQAMEAVQE